MTFLKTPDMLIHLEKGKAAQCVNASRTNELDLQPKFHNPYCVVKEMDGSVRWYSGKRGILAMGPFIMEEALWEVEK